MTDLVTDKNRGKTWQQTMRLRFLDSPYGPKLQQAWFCREDGAIKWEDVPHVAEEPTP